jgi:hypothetical protein
MSKFSFWKSRNIIWYQQKVYTSKTLLQLVKSEIIMLIESIPIPRKSIETCIFVNELKEVVELIKYLHLKHLPHIITISFLLVNPN